MLGECATIHIPIGDLPPRKDVIFLPPALHSSAFHKAERGSSKGACIKLKM